MQKYFNKNESAKYLGISRWTFTRWIEIGLVTPGYPVSPKSFSRRWTSEQLDNVSITIKKMNMVREIKNG
jgi:predicted site-specific integrase-resolvase